MVIKYKAKYIRDGAVVIDDTALIELGSGDSDKPAPISVLPKSRDTLEQMIAESEDRRASVNPDRDTTSDEK